MHSFFDVNVFAGQAGLHRLWELGLDWSVHWVTARDIQLYHVWNLEKLGHSCGPWLNTVLPLSSCDTRIHAHRCNGHILSVLDKHRHSWFGPNFQDSAYSNRIEPFFFSAHFLCMCVCVTRVSCRLCSIAHVSMTGPLTEFSIPHGSVLVCVEWKHNVAIQCCERGDDLWCFKLWLRTCNGTPAAVWWFPTCQQ